MYNIKQTEKELWSFNFLYLVLVFILDTVFWAFTLGLKYGDFLTHATKKNGINCKGKEICFSKYNMHLLLYVSSRYIPGRHSKSWGKKPSTQVHLSSKHLLPFIVPVHCEAWTHV